MFLHAFGCRLTFRMRISVFSGLLLLVCWTLSIAQLTTDITSDGTLGTEVTQNGNVHEITGGMRPGDGQNLFHSFGRFHVGTGDTAHFVGEPGIEHIIGRVTGADASMIDGTLQSDANLFLLNPQGLLFREHARLDVNGSFHASTADVLRFADGAAFSARLSKKSTLTVAHPSAFGLLSNNPAGIQVQGSELAVPQGETLSMVGGNIAMTGGTLKAPSGQVAIASVLSRGDVGFDSTRQMPELDLEAFDRLGDIEIVRGAQIQVSGDRGGMIVIRSGRLLVDRSEIMTEVQGAASRAGAGIDIDVAEDITLAHDATIVSRTMGAARSGGVAIDTAGLTLTGGAFIDSYTSGQSQGSNIMVTADSIRISGQGRFASGIYSETVSGPASGGLITIAASRLDISASGRIETLTTGAGPGGSIRIKADHVMLTEGARIASNTAFRASGAAGDIEVIANARLFISGISEAERRSGIVSQSTESSSGRAGNLTLATPLLQVEESGVVQSTSVGEGAPGDIDIRGESMTLTGGAAIDNSVPDQSVNAGNVTIVATASVTISGRGRNGLPSGVMSETFDSDAGSILLSTPLLQIEAGGLISTRTGGSGRGGDMVIDSDMVVLREGAAISAESLGRGDAGSIRIVAREIALSHNSALTTTVGQGEASGGSILIGRGITDDGDIVEGVERLILDASRITADTDTGDGANITIGAQRVLLDHASTISANTGNGSGGNLRVAGATMDGIAIDRAQAVVLRGSAITAHADRGTGGRIDILTEAFLADPASSVDASSQEGGIDGEVNIEAVVSNPSEVVKPLSQHLAPETPLLRDRCAARLHQGMVSSFVERERAGTSSAPDGWLPSRLDTSHAWAASSGVSLTYGSALSSGPSWRVSSRCP